MLRPPIPVGTIEPNATSQAVMDKLRLNREQRLTELRIQCRNCGAPSQVYGQQCEWCKVEVTPYG